MRRVKFAKYNKMRKDQFQIKTTIYEENGVTYVEKAALLEAGFAHIKSLLDKYNKIKDMNENLAVLKPELASGSMKYPFIEGKTLSECLVENKQKGTGLIEELNKALDLIFHVKEQYITDFSITEGFTEVFGEIPHLKGEALTVANIDALFDNILETEAGLVCLDYEWVFDFPVPLEYLKYRNLIYFYFKYKNLLSYDTCDEFLEEFGISRAYADVFTAMEFQFQQYVHGIGHECAYMNQYIQEKTHFHKLLEYEDSMVGQLARIIELQKEVEEKNRYNRMLQETIRLTQNHVTNLEAAIAGFQADIAHKDGELIFLRANQSTGSIVKKNITNTVDSLLPRGSRKRKVLGYAKRTITQPAKSAKLYFTQEGRNLITGDFNIGSLYLESGMIRFPYEEKPKVSIIIPVYNQIHYTYPCLLSILENTKDVAYEVIIADDVSTDATTEIGKYVKNIGICRNKENLGFLKNCNNAAKHARGEYVLFLNNDTQVQPEWLSSLVELMESDQTIGMAGSKLIYPDGRLQEAGGILWSDGSGWNYGRLDDPNKPEYNYVKDVDYISGAAIMLSKKLWENIGGFDERYAPAYCEDSDLAFAVRDKGYRVVYQPLSVVVHFEGISNGTDVNGTGIKKYQVENSKKLKEKWADEFAKQCYNDGNPNPFLARERGQGKPVILFIDHYVPTFDKDAGSKTTYQYIKMFLKKGYSVKFVGDNYLHEEPYTTALQQMGVEVLYGADYQVKIWDWIKDNQEYIQFAYLNRPHIATKYIDYMKDHTVIKVIYYGHDLHFLREMREYELTGDTMKQKSSNHWRTAETTLMYHADMSYYPSYVEVDAIHAIDQSIRVKAITAYVYEEFLSDIQDDFSKRNGLLFVGGFAHPPNKDAVLWFINEVYPLIVEKMEIPFYIVGSKAPEEIKALDGNGIVVKGFVSEEELSELYASCKVVVVPLRYGAGVKGKVVEALYNGTPIITTSVGAEGIPFVEETLVIRDEAEEFAKEVLALYEDEGRLRALSHISQEFVKEHFSIDAAWEVIKEDFKADSLN